MPNAYWLGRLAQRGQYYDRAATATMSRISRAYSRALTSLDNDVEDIIGNFASISGLSKREAMRWLNQPTDYTVLDKLRARAATVTDPIEKRRLMSELNAPAYRARISRLQAMHESANVAMTKAADVQLTETREHLTAMAKGGYARETFDIQKAAGLGYEMAGISQADIRRILTNRWSGENFSSRVWQNRDALVDTLQDGLLDVLTVGKATPATFNKLTEELANNVDRGRFAANRLLRTETAYVTGQAELQAYADAGIERYEFVAVLDNRTSAVCFVGTDKAYSFSDIEKVFRRHYSGNLITVTTSGEKQITGTPDHPVLTPDGWLTLDKIEPGNQILYSVPSEFLVIPRKKHINVPTALSELFDAFSKVSRVKVFGAGSTAAKFNGDGNAVNDKIYIEDTDRILRGNNPAMFNHGIIKDFFSRTKRRVFLSALGCLCKSRECGSIVCMTPEVKVIVPNDRIKPYLAATKKPHNLTRAISLVKQFDCPVCVKARLLVALVTLDVFKQPVIFKEGRDGCCSDRIFIGQFACGYAVPVLEEYVIAKSVQNRTCHVYNLQTLDRAYINNNIIVHNCQELDGQTFPVDKAEVGVNYNPMHPFCRSTTAPVIDGVTKEGQTRRARDTRTGEVQTIPADMRYNEWSAWQKDGAPPLDAWRAGRRGDVLAAQAPPVTFESFAKHVKDTYGLDVPDEFRKLDINAIQTSFSGLEKLMAEFPATNGMLSGIEPLDIGIMGYDYDGTLYFNAKYYQTMKTVEDAISYGHHKGIRVESLGMHEGGHMLELELIRRQAQGGGYLARFMWEKNVVSTRIINEAYLAAVKTQAGIGQTMSEMIHGVSEYAAQDMSECMAECVSDYMTNGQNASPLSLSVWDILKRELI
jgi:SPP1 gp7 family putative phage head morphogenesis protein